MTTNTGGPAFPIPLNPGQSWQRMSPCDGMTLLDYFAAKAMQGLIGRYSHESDISRIAYKIANAMLKAREA